MTRTASQIKSSSPLGNHLLRASKQGIQTRLNSGVDPDPRHGRPPGSGRMEDAKNKNKQI